MFVIKRDEPKKLTEEIKIKQNDDNEAIKCLGTVLEHLNETKKLMEEIKIKQNDDNESMKCLGTVLEHFNEKTKNLIYENKRLKKN
jgi:hypothetical protein